MAVNINTDFMPYKLKYDEFMLKYQVLPYSSEASEKLFHNFSKTYLSLPSFWSEKLKNECTLSRNVSIGVKNLKQTMFDFYSESVYDSCPARFRWRFERLPFHQLLNGRGLNGLKLKCEKLQRTKKCQILLKDALSFPHSKLKEVFECYEIYSGSFITSDIRQLYHKSQQIYDKIVANKNDVEAWFNSVIESKDNRFIIQNVETRIAEEYSDIALWKLYIKFLMNKNKNAAYEVYYRFSRLFLNDKSFKNDFILWKNKPPSTSGNRYLDRMKYQTPDWKKIKTTVTYPPSPLFFNPESQKCQTFIFPFEMMKIIFAKAKPEILQKLYQCTKCFYSKIQKPLCYTLYVTDICDPNYYCNSLAINEQSLNFEGLTKIYVTNQIIVKAKGRPIRPPNRQMLSTIIPKLNPCNICILQIVKQDISTFDYQFLTKTGNIERIVFENVSIKYPNSNYHITIEEFFANLSKATVIKAPIIVTITTASWNFLIHCKKFAKIDEMYFPFCTEINQVSMLKFFCTNGNNNCRVFCNNADLCLSLNHSIKNIKEHAKPKNIEHIFFPNIIFLIPFSYTNLSLY